MFSLKGQKTGFPGVQPFVLACAIVCLESKKITGTYWQLTKGKKTNRLVVQSVLCDQRLALSKAGIDKAQRS
ncbi:hypothetical protein FAES_5238 [Fibrella aestuarina BUZ 2]|uniref:Uncharacterized protein n=1 Tax=Fibrella aestuarina BUZ 2 TaxID=1166018 RepID=I0KGI4_9BACT|nr:hypothetical protein FAES_5238 [Fibrella aestuarina BUZ 2]